MTNEQRIKVTEIKPEYLTDRERIAQAMGYRLFERTNGQYTDRWWFPEGENPEAGYPSHPIPDPEHNANDCEALIRWLNDEGWWLIVNHHNTRRSGANIKVGKGISDPAYDWEGDDWKTGVCELALRILDDSKKEEVLAGWAEHDESGGFDD